MTQEESKQYQHLIDTLVDRLNKREEEIKTLQSTHSKDIGELVQHLREIVDRTKHYLSNQELLKSESLIQKHTSNT